MDNNKLINQIGSLIDIKLLPLKNDLGVVKKDLSGVKKDQKGLKKDLSGVRRDVNRVKNQIGGVQKQLDTVELKVELVNKRVGETHQELQTSIKQSQEETIDTLSALIHTGYNLHEKRIKKIEDTLQITTPQQ